MKYLHTYFYKRATERENKKIICPLTKRKVNGLSAKSLVLTCYNLQGIHRSVSKLLLESTI